MKRLFLFFMLFGFVLSQRALALSIVLDGTQTLISGSECQNPKYRFGTQSSYQGQDIDIILEVLNSDNDYSGDKCVDIIDNVIGFRLKDNDSNDNSAYMDIKLTVVKKGTETPLSVDTITVTNFDLDNNPEYTDTDDVYYQNPTKVYLSESSNVEESYGDFFGTYTTRLKGQDSGNCDDSATLLQEECRGGVSFDNTSSFYARVENDDAYGRYINNSLYRLIQFSFELKDLTPLMSTVELPCGSEFFSTSGDIWTIGETPTEYNNNINISKTIKIENSESIKVTVSGETEDNYDWVYIYDENGNEIYRDSGVLNSTPIIASGSQVTIKLTTDGSVTKNGATIKIEGINCEDDPTISITSPTPKLEGDSGDKDLIFNVFLDNPAPSGGVDVQITPTNITALEGEDYSRLSSSIHFDAGETQKSIIYKIHGDVKVEDNETFSVLLHNAQNAIIDENHKSAIGTILNDDEEIFISIDNNASIIEGDSGTRNLDFKILLSHTAPIGGVQVQIQPHNITALEGEDFSRNSSSIFFNEGESEKTISYSIKGDTKVEDNETFSIELLSPVGAKLDESRKEAIGTIVNDDLDNPNLVAEYRFDECPIDMFGKIKDSSPNQYDHLVKNSLTTENNISKINRSGKFVASKHQYTQGENGLDTIFGNSSHEFTVTTWVYPTSLGTAKTNHNTANTFFAKASDRKNDNIEIGINSNGTLHLYLDTIAKDKYADFGNSGDISTNSWHFIGVSYKDGVVTVQIDDKTYTNNTTWSGATVIDQAVGSPVSIGASLHIDNYFDGYIDEFKIFQNRISHIGMNNIRVLEESGKNWDNTTRDSVECSGATPIGCLMSAFMFQNKPTDINVLNLANGEMNPAVEDVSLDNINAVGFNKKDGYFWGYNYTKQNGTLTRIGMNSQGVWVAEDFLVDGLNGFKSYVGDIDDNGHIYLKERGTSKRVVVIDLDPNSNNYLKKIREFNLAFSLDTADWGFNAVDDMLYAVNNGSASKYLYKIDPSNGHLISRKNTMLTGSRGFGASFFDANGFYYVYDNYSGNIYRIDVASSPEAVLFANANMVSYNDGAMCTDAEFKFDFGDLPEVYPTKLESDGARHSLPIYNSPTVYLGSGVSNENNGKPSTDANLDDNDDGVKIGNSSLQDKTIEAGEVTTIKVETHGVGYLSAWIDWNGDGDFDDANEKIASNIDGSSGLITLNVTAPSSAIDIVTYARFRYSYQMDLEPTGNAIDGEVEDYKINIHGNLEPFSCSDKLYLSNRTESGIGSGDSGATWLHSFLATAPIFTPIGEGFSTVDGGYNAMGYNPQDNFIYALYGSKLLKIDKNANIQNLGSVDGLADTQLYAGTFDRDGFYFVGGDSDKIYKIDIAQKKVIDTIDLESSLKFSDMAIDSTDQYLYAMLLNENGSELINDKFVKIDKNSGAITIIKDNYNDIGSYIPLIYTDQSGKIIAISKESGMYEIDPLSGNAYWINATSEINYNNDGANCPDSSFVLPPRVPRLSISDVAQAEGNSGESIFEFKVSIDANLPMMPFGAPIMFYYKVIDGDGNEITPPHGVALQSDHDFQGSNGIGINMNIFSNSRETTISVPVYGDTKVEPDEEFFVDIYFPQPVPQTFCMLGKSRGVGTILNDDMRFVIERTNSDEVDNTTQTQKESLYTQIAGRDFDYSIVSYKLGSEPNPLNDITLKVELKDNSNSNTLYTGYKYIASGSRIDIIDPDDLAIIKAVKDASFKVYYLKDANGTIVHGRYDTLELYNQQKSQNNEISQDASDHFAIRPAGYKVAIEDIDENNNTITYRDSSQSNTSPLHIVAGYNYKLHTQAISIDANNSITQGYTTQDDINATLIFNDKSTCNDTSDATLEHYSFVNGELRDYISHDNVGKYLLKIKDSSWSDIDKEKGDCIEGSSTISQNGNEKSGCDIETNTLDNFKEISVQFHPYEFALDGARVENIPFSSSKDFVYMNDLSQSLDMALAIKTDIVAQSKEHTKLTNFTYSCQAEDVILSLGYKITTDKIDAKPTYDKIFTTKDSEVTFKKVIAYNGAIPTLSDVETAHLDNNITISADKFLNINEGNSSIEILYNLTKNLSEPINPIKIDFENLEVNSTVEIAKIKDKPKRANGIGDLSISKKLYFASIAPDRENYPDEYDRYCVTPISALIFCDHNKTWCTDMIGNNGLNNQRTAIGWYTSILHDSNKDGKVVGFSINNLLVNVTPKAENLPNFNENRGRITQLTTGYSGNDYPTRVQIDMDLSPWLKYHRDPTRNGIPFWRNTFRDKNATWSGVGKTGKQLDTKITTIPAKKISW